MIGTILKGYQIVDKVKDGSVGTIWKAVNNQGKTYAIKMLSERNAARPDKRKEFKREAKLAMGLEHRNIIHVYEYFDARPFPFFVMEYFDSDNLKYCMWHHSERVYTKEFYILRQVAESLQYLHTNGVVHRDLKPENVLLNKDSEAKLIDFSIALTKMDTIFPFFRPKTAGTPLYMAPEQIQNRKITAKTDIYAFGVLMFEILTKRPPYIGTSVKSIFEKHMTAPVPSMRLYVKTISQELDDLNKAMLAKNPDERPKDMTTIIYQLSKWERQLTQIRVLQVNPVEAKEQRRPI